MPLTKFLQKLVDKRVLTTEEAEFLQLTTSRERKELCMVKGCGTGNLSEDYTCDIHSKTKAKSEKQFWHFVGDGDLETKLKRRRKKKKIENETY